MNDPSLMRPLRTTQKCSFRATGITVSTNRGRRPGCGNVGLGRSTRALREMRGARRRQRMVWRRHDYEAIPGTYVFDGKTAHSAYALNKLLFSFNSADNRAQYAADPGAYADKYGLTPEQKAALLADDFLG